MPAVSSSRDVAMTRLPAALEAILRDTSRSVYLTLRVLPRAIRRQLMLGYLFCRAADTIADTRALPPSRRVGALGSYRALFEERGSGDTDARDAALREITALVENVPGAAAATDAGFSAAEAALLRQLEACFAVHEALEAGDRALLRRLLRTLTRGMTIDLETFPAEELAREGDTVTALGTEADLDRYCYHVAGCVGEFWTDLAVAHLAALGDVDHETLRQLGVRFGKGLQMTNILRDMPADLRLGRCYVPRSLLEEHGISPEEFGSVVRRGDTASGDRLMPGLAPILDRLLDRTLEHHAAGLEYTLSIPRRLVRLRLACIWPLVIGLATLAELRAGKRRLVGGARLKISRGRVYRLVLASAWRIFSNRALLRLFARLEEGARRG